MDKGLWVEVWRVFVSWGVKNLVSNFETKSSEAQNLTKSLKKIIERGKYGSL